MQRELGWLSLRVTVGLMMVFTGAADAADPEPTLADALEDGEVGVELRYRFEDVSEDAFAQDAHASTLRTTLSYRTGSWRGWSLHLEAENVTELGFEDQFANRGAGSLSNGVFDRPVIADPELTEANQAYLRYATGDTRVDLGRQEIALGDQRFVGPVGWRQNHQSFDALRVHTEDLGPVTLDYAFVDTTNRVFGDDRAMASHLLYAGWQLPLGTLTGYGFFLDYDRVDLALSTDTFGLEWQGERTFGERKVLFEGEWAHQTDGGDNPEDVDAGYLHLVLGGGLPAGTARVGWEVLEGSPEDGAFRTPLATLHAWNGWADKFLVTPITGLEDLYVTLAGKAGAVGWTVTWHDFSAESAGMDYGTELDLQLSYRSGWGQLFGVKGAFYDADQLSTDTEKIWLWTAYGF